MFELKKVELLGFKSFADRTRLEFADGIAAIVGPNGCGKSNLADAISWVLGEQSARMLRGERMADVIFAGTSNRPPTGLAEVSLTLVDPAYVKPPEEPTASDGSAEGIPTFAGMAATDGPASEASQPRLHNDSGEIVVTRRLFRSGESEYLLNGDLCRLRDIQDLFMGTGLGPESYAIIEQGRIGQILSSKPSDRRSIIEEAAGVSKFKSRKRLAEAKLESSRQNLSRITDILEEVTKQVNSLKRQASKARRYREMREELRGRLKAVLSSQLFGLESQCQRLQDEITLLQEKCSLAGQNLAELEREHKIVTQHLEESENRLTRIREAMAQGELDQQRLQSRVEQIRDQVASLDARIAESAQESGKLRSQADQLDKEAADLATRAEQLHREWTMAQEEAADLATQKEESAAQVAAGESEVDAARQALLVAVSDAAELRNQLVQVEEVRLSLDRQAKRAEADKAATEQECLRLMAESEALGSDHQRGESTLAALLHAAAETEQSLNSTRQDEARQRTQLETLRQEYSAAVARKQTLEESLARHAYSTDSVRKLLTIHHDDNGHSFRPMGLLADFVEVSPGYEEVVEEFLKQDLECVVVEGHAEARAGIGLLKSDGSGRSTFFVTRFPGNGHSNGDDGAEVRGARGVVANVRDLVRFEPRLGLNGDLPLPDLQNAYVVETAEVAEQLAGRYPDCHFLTPSGEHYHHRLVTGGKGASAGPLALRRDFRDLERKTAELDLAVLAADGALAERAACATRLEGQLRSLTAEKLDAEKKAVLANEKLRQTREACDRLEERARILTTEVAALESQREAAVTREADLRSRLEAAIIEQKQREVNIQQASGRLRELRGHLDRVLQLHAEAQARAGSLQERARAAEAERGRVAAQAEDVRIRIHRLNEQASFWRTDQERLAEESESASARRAAVEEQLAAARIELREEEQESQASKARRDHLATLIDEARAAYELHRGKRAEADVALARVEADRTHRAQQCRDELGADPSQLLAELIPDAQLSGDALQAAEEEVRALRARIEALGPVNMMALEELQESEERFAFLETQRQDLCASIEDTAQAIREIDEVSRLQFLEAFAAINRNFAETFRTLFGGGIGEMRLSDDSDPDSGLDVVAQPPGKRLQNVLLLSGGEKALAALALLMAVFRFTPSPFCILDEVDAPLDESNVDRFTNLIRQMCPQTQFILITHNKRTMEIAKLMYGVTMEEPGISKLVSVRFDEIEAEPLAVPA